MKTKRHLFNTNFYQLGEVKYAAGQHYPVTAETTQRALAGDAEEITVDLPADEVREESAEAQAALEAERAQTLAAEAEAAEKAKTAAAPADAA